MKRLTSVRGQFYPAEQSELREMITDWKRSATIKNAIAALLPHAGYIYSGECAWLGITALDWEQIKRIVVIGPSHRIPFLGISVFPGSSYETVGGDHPADSQFAEIIKKSCGLITVDAAHHEHSTEAQFPLLHQIAPTVPFVECVYGTNCEHALNELLSFLRSTSGTGIVISSDLSHYYTELQAHDLDHFITESITKLDFHSLELGEACGKPGIGALIHLAQQENAHLQLIDYRTSADSPNGDCNRVVGYCSAVLITESQSVA